MTRFGILLLLLLAAAKASPAAAQLQVFEPAPQAGKGPTPTPRNLEGKEMDSFWGFVDEHKAMRPGSHRSIQLWDAGTAIDTSNPYGRIAADCINLQTSLDVSGMRDANRCIATRTKNYQASLGGKSGKSAAVNNTPTPGSDAGMGEPVPQPPQ